MSSFTPLGHTFETYRPGVGVAATAIMAGVVLGFEVIAPHLRKSTYGTRFNGETGDIYAFDGLRCANADAIKNLLEPQLGPIDSVHYSPKDGVNPDSIAEAFQARFQEAPYHKPFSIIGRSLGLVAGLAGLEQCARNGTVVPPIQSVWGVSSPRDYRDVHNSGKYRHLPQVVGKVGGVFTKVTGVLVTDLWGSSHKTDDLVASIDYLITHFGDIQSPQQWSTHLKMAYTASQLGFNALVDCGALREDTQVMLTYEKDDNVINSPLSAGRWYRELAALGVDVTVRMGETNRHADMSVVPKSFWQTEKKAYSVA